MPRIKDVADLAGVSISTVSNVINENRYVSEDLRIKVQQVVEQLNYEVDPIARSLKSKYTMTLGVIITSFSRIFFPQVLSGMQTIACELGYNLIINSTDDDFAKEQQYIKMLVNNKVDGIILDTVAHNDNVEYFNYLANLSRGNKRIPVLSIERNLSKFDISSIFVDNYKGGKLATQHIINNGAKSVLHISGPEKSDMSRSRFSGYKAVLEENSIILNPELFIVGDFSPLSGYSAVKCIFEKDMTFDGIIADNDQMAIGAMKAVLEHKYKVPDDIKIVGFDDTFVSSIVNPPLTTIHVPKHRMGILAVQCLADIINGTDSTQLKTRELPIELIIRESTNPHGVSDWELEYW